MRILLDTCILSELLRPDCDEKLRKYILNIPDENLFVSVISIAEIIKGVSFLNDSKKKQELQSWVYSLERFYEDRIKNIDYETAQIWGEMTATAQKRGVVIPAIDGLIASSARRHGLHMMTRNTSNFEHTGVMLVQPWDM